MILNTTMKEKLFDVWLVNGRKFRQTDIPADIVTNVAIEVMEAQKHGIDIQVEIEISDSVGGRGVVHLDDIWVDTTKDRLGK